MSGIFTFAFIFPALRRWGFGAEGEHAASQGNW